MEESYYGLVQTASDALLIFEACRLGVLNKVERRLSEKERHLVRSGAVFVWEEEQTGMRRWTDGRSWTASRIHGNFLIYRELEGKRKSSTSATSIANTATSPDIGSAPSSSPLESGFVKIPADVSNTVPSVAAQSASGSPSSSAALIGTFKNMANLKMDGLIKLSFSVTLVTGNRYHLVHYYTPADVLSGLLKKPSKDPALADITISREYYPDTVNNIRTGDLKFHPRRSLSPNSREKVPSKRLDMSQAPRSVFGTACDTNPEQGQEVQLENRPPLQIHASNSLDLGTPTALVMDTNPGTWLYQQNSYETIAHLPLLSSEFSRPLSHILGTNDMNTDNFRQGSVSSHSLSASSNGSEISSYIPLTPPAYFTTFSLQPAPYQEVAWEKFPNSEIKRQLEAVYAMLSL